MAQQATGFTLPESVKVTDGPATPKVYLDDQGSPIHGTGTYLDPETGSVMGPAKAIQARPGFGAGVVSSAVEGAKGLVAGALKSVNPMEFIRGMRAKGETDAAIKAHLEAALAGKAPRPGWSLQAIKDALATWADVTPHQVGETVGALAALPVVAKVLPAMAGNRAPRTSTTLPTPLEQAVEFGAERGIPVDAATRANNPAVSAVQAVVEHSPGGGFVATRARANQAASQARVAGELAQDAHPQPVTPEQAGQATRGAVQKLTGDLGQQADTAYTRLRDIEADPTHGEYMDSAPNGSRAARRIREKLAAGLEDGRVPSDAELLEMRRIQAELESQPFQKGKQFTVDDPDQGQHSEYARGSRNADVYHEILQAAPGTSDITGQEMLSAIRKTLNEGTWTDASRGAYQVARDRLRAGRSGMPIPTNTPLVGSSEFVHLPVDITPVQEAVASVYQRLQRESELAPLMGGKADAYRALDRIMSAPARVSASVADAALGDLKSMARTEIPELRTQGQGLVGAAIKSLEAEVQKAVAKAGPDAVNALREGRAATVGKYQVGDVLETLKTEPVQVYRMATAPKDAQIGLLRRVAEAAPAEPPKIGRAWLEEQMQTATAAEGGWKNAKTIQGNWLQMGPETKKLLFPDPVLRESLDRFFLLGKKIAEQPNPSGTALVSSSVGGVWVLMNPMTGIPYTLGTAVLAKMLHSPRALNALNTLLSYRAAGVIPKAVQASAVANVINQAKALSDETGESRRIGPYTVTEHP